MMCGHVALQERLSRIALGGLTSRTLSYPDLVDDSVEFLEAAHDAPVFGDLYRLEADIVGKGAFGVPYPGWHEDSECVVKIINKEVAGAAYQDHLVDNGILKVLLRMERHANIVEYLDMLEGPVHYYEVMERLNGMELFDYVVSQMPMTEFMVQNVMRQVLSALAHMHDSCQLCHNDVKLENFRFKEHGNQGAGLKLLDFGMARISGTTLEDSITGTLLYLAPEVIARQETERCKHALPSRDIWAAGVILYIMLTGKEPWEDREVHFLVGDAGKKHLDKALSAEDLKTRSPEAQDLLRSLLNLNYRTRITAAQALEHPWFEGKNNKKTAMNQELLAKTSDPSLGKIDLPVECQFMLEDPRQSLHPSSDCDDDSCGRLCQSLLSRTTSDNSSVSSFDSDMFFYE
jgi:serine/threonine protein kinase